MEIPKKRNRKSPEMANIIIIRKDTNDAFRATFLRCASSKSMVIVINTGIAPNGFINVKKEVKHNKPKVNISLISIEFWSYYCKRIRVKGKHSYHIFHFHNMI